MFLLGMVVRLLRDSVFDIYGDVHAVVCGTDVLLNVHGTTVGILRTGECSGAFLTPTEGVTPNITPIDSGHVVTLHIAKCDVEVFVLRPACRRDHSTTE
jgi:hypothetical protein